MNNKINNYTIIDWDDTLFPTTWTALNDIDINNLDNIYIKDFKKLDYIVSILLNKLQKYSTVIIVSNAMRKWIIQTLNLMPLTKREMKNIDIISARELYQNRHSPLDWKKHTFKYIINSKLNGQPLHIISIGDSEYEYDALVDLFNWQQNHKKTLKAIKLLKEPSMHILLDELTVLYKSASLMCNYPTHIDWVLVYE